MNNIWRKDIYRGVIDSYIKMPGRFKIKGTLLETDRNNIKVDIGSKKALHITLDKPMDAQVGDDIVIDRRNIVDSKLIKQDESSGEEQGAVQDLQDKYDYILKSLDIPINDESIEAVKSLENHGVDITKENILSFMAAKEQLSNISENLDYDTAIKLVEKDMDFDKESLQKVLQEMQKVQGDKRPFSLLRFLGIKKDMSTEEAESIAYDIYGNRTGKDITDIIKALDKAGLDTSKENIEQINRIFSKLHDIKDIGSKTIIDSVKNRIETSIDNLYKLKNTVVKGTIKAERKLGQLAGKIYETFSGAVGTPTERDLVQIEGDIKDRLQYIGIKITDEIVELSKDVITTGLDLTKENLQKIMIVKGAVIELNSDLDYEKTALLMASGVEVEKIDVAELRDMIDTEYDTENTEHNAEHISREHSSGHTPVAHDTEHISSEQDTKHVSAEHDTEHISTEHNTEHISMEHDMEHIPVEPGAEHISVEDTEHISAEYGTKNIPAEHNTEHVTVEPDIGDIPAERGITLGLDRLEILELVESIDIKTLALHIKLDLPTTPESLNLSQQLIDGDITADEWLNTLNEQLNPDVRLNQNEQLHSDVQSTEMEQIMAIDKAELMDALDRLTNTEIRELDFIAQNYLKTNSGKLGTLMEENYMDEIAKAIMQSGIPLNNNNIKEMYMLKRILDRIVETLSPDVFQNAIEEGISLEKTDLKGLVDIINLLNSERASQNTEIKNLLNAENINTEGALEAAGDTAQDTGNAEKTENMAQSVEYQDILESKSQIIGNRKTENIVKDAENTIGNKEIISKENIKQGETSENVPANMEEITDEDVSINTEELTDKNVLINAKKAEEIADKMKGMVNILKQISPERKNTIISLLMKNAMPLTLKEVQNLSFFLNNQRQIGHQLDEILNLIDKNKNTEIIKVADELKNIINKINRHIKEGRQTEDRPYEDFSRLLKELESKSSFLTAGEKETLQKSGGKLLDSLELQLQLNREDTVLQLPLMMSEYLKNLQIYVMRDKKGRKKIDPRDMSILLNFDTNNMGNVNIYVAVNYKNIVMKMGLADEKDQNLIEKYSVELEEHLEELGYDLKDLSFRISDDNHILSMADEMEKKNPKIKRLLDVRI